MLQGAPGISGPKGDKGNNGRRGEEGPMVCIDVHIIIITWTFYMLCLLNVIGIKRNIILQVHSGLLEVFFFSNRVVNRLNMLDQQIVGAASVNAFKNGLAKLRKTKMGFFMD